VLELKVTSAKLTGAPGTSGWAQIHDHTPTDPDKLKKRGRLFAVIATNNGTEGVESVTMGREVLTRLHEEFFGNTEQDAFKALQAAIEKITKEFAVLSLEIAASCFIGEILYVCVGGSSQAAVFRDGSMAKILVGSKDKVASASGYPKNGDYFILGSESFFSSISEEQMKKSLISNDPIEIVETLAPILHSIKQGGSLAANLLFFSENIASEPVIKTDKIDEKRTIKIKESKLLGQRGFSLFSSLKKRLPQRRIYVGRGEEAVEDIQKRKTTLTAGAVLLVLLVISIGFGLVQKVKRDEREAYEGRLLQAIHELDEAEGLFTLNSERARELFSNSKNTAQSLKAEGIDDPQLEALLLDITDKEEKILREYKTDPGLFLNLALFSEGFSGADMASSGEEMFILDKENRKIIQVSVATKNSEIVAGPAQIDSPISILSYEDRVFVLNDEGIVAVDSNGNKELVVEKDWGDPRVYAYAGNIYLLDKNDSSVYRYPGTGEEFLPKQSWLAPGIDIDFSKSANITIDGSIWVLTQTGKITKLTNGNPQNYSTDAVFPAITSAFGIYTNENLNNVYILDKTGNRVIVTDKEGNYQAQYFSEKIGTAIDLVVSEEAKKIILLTGSELMSIDFKHE